MSRVSRVLVPVSVTVALLVSGLQTQAFADSAKSSAPSATADLRGWRSQSNQPNPELNAVLPAGVASNEQAPSLVKRDGRRVKELPGRRTPTSKVFQLADGRTEAELSSEPIHFQASDGTLEPIDTSVKASRAAGFSLANETNSFRSFFGTRSNDLVKLDLGGQG